PDTRADASRSRATAASAALMTLSPCFAPARPALICFRRSSTAVGALHATSTGSLHRSSVGPRQTSKHVWAPTPSASEPDGDVRARTHPSGCRPVVPAYRLPLAGTGLLGRLSVLQHVRLLRGDRAHRRARDDGLVIFRRQWRDLGGLWRRSSRRRPPRRKVAAARHDADDPAAGARRV